MEDLDSEKYKIDYELLALFDDVAALSQLEYNTLDLSCLEVSFYDESRLAKIEDRRDKKMDDRQPHAKTDHEEKNEVFAVPTVYSCMYCLKRFYSRSACHRHQVCHAKQQLRCPYCKMRSYSANVLRRHFEYFHPCARRKQILIEAQW
ncbi:unnamed protein product [Xylocopa violacea]|uniref:C2H2-type domain-containing protein n=1 Tax=Xylocopa violacea TaxID=135666 RepID=A0ABP1NXE9_XYLVO